MQFDRILEVHVVVAGAVDEQELTLQFFYVRERRVIVVAAGILLRKPQIPFSINRIVKPPRGYGRDRNTYFEILCA